MNRRSVARKRVQQPVTLEEPHTGVRVASIRDLSLGGAFVLTDARLSRNGRLVAVFELDDARRHEFRLEATVVRITARGAGLMFVNTPPDEIRHLSEALFRL